MITRRDLLASGIALSASPLLARPVRSGNAASLAGDPLESSSAGIGAIAPREQLLFDFGWKFRFGHGSDPARDLGFGYGQATFSKTAMLRVEALDGQGRLVPTVNSRIAFKVSGNGALIGVGNGNPNCQESDKEPRRTLFHGLAQVILQSTTEPGEIQIEAMRDDSEGPELSPAKLTITTTRAQPRPTVPWVARLVQS